MINSKQETVKCTLLFRPTPEQHITYIKKKLYIINSPTTFDLFASFSERLMF